MGRLDFVVAEEWDLSAAAIDQKLDNNHHNKNREHPFDCAEGRTRQHIRHADQDAAAQIAKRLAESADDNLQTGEQDQEEQALPR